MQSTPRAIREIDRASKISTRLAIIAGIALSLGIGVLGLWINYTGRLNQEPYGPGGLLVLVISLGTTLGYHLGSAMKTESVENKVFIFWSALSLCHAEVASRFTDAGGPYLYSREAFGAFVGVQAGWLSFCIRVTSMGANLNVFADYLAQILPVAGQGGGRVLTLVVVTAVVTWLNVIGVRTGARTVDLFVVAKILPLLLLVVLALPRVSSDVLATQRVPSPDWTQAILLLVFAYGGFEAALIPAGEVKDPRRDSAFALLVGMGVVATLYMLVQVAVVGVLPSAARFPAPVAATFGVLLGAAGVTLGSLAAMVASSRGPWKGIIPAVMARRLSLAE